MSATAFQRLRREQARLAAEEAARRAPSREATTEPEPAPAPKRAKPGLKGKPKK